MSISPEELAAFADGELIGEDEARVAAAVAADEDLARQVEKHRALKAKLSGHFAPILKQEVPEHLKQMLAGADESEANEPAEVVDFAAARERRDARRTLPGWGWAGGAIAASLVAVLVFTTGDEARPGYADAQLASALDSQLVATQPGDADTRILLSFRNDAGEFCRAYSAAQESGIACRDSEGWRQQVIGAGSESAQTEFRMAGSEAEILEAAQDMASGPALSAEEEAEALKQSRSR
ncbi:transcriptional regulator [Altererythrobacter arenosus]|uniref:Transcriptional regulator n=1 Tax=Altererythrobacter arenosus TaxID=3032592 RepID=A0ABY8G0L2_9SPHN|nr:transcriptional regulator [Altererythrobacter sp. CAU 1644]WFL77794.1 transcriptional regulator [Altererythrobacter sp. CAU 1644]